MIFYICGGAGDGDRDEALDGPGEGECATAGEGVGVLNVFHSLNIALCPLKLISCSGSYGTSLTHSGSTQ